MLSGGVPESEKSNSTRVRALFLVAPTPMFSGLMSRWETPFRSSQSTTVSSSSPKR
jgi:hypothetical protein